MSPRSVAPLSAGAHRRSLIAASLGALLTLVAGMLPTAALAEFGPGSIGGTVYDTAGTPAANIVVSACAGTCTHAISAANGTYAITGLVAGNYRLGITDDAGNLAGGFATVTGTTTSAAAATLVPVAAGPIVFDIFASAGHLVSGTITATAGGPIGDVLIDVCITGTSGPDSGFLPCGFDATSSDGTFFVNVLPATYKLFVFDLAHTHASGYYASTGYVLPWRLATPIVVAATDVAGINLALPPGASLAGSVTDNAGAPVDGMDVTACLSTDIEACLYSSTVADGSYTVNGLPVGSYDVIFSTSDASQPTGVYGPSGFAGDSGLVQPVAVGTTGATGIDVRLPVGHVVSGRVTDAAGKPAYVDIQDCTTKFCVPVATTAADGSYRISVASGTHVIHASDYSGLNLSGYYSTAGLANWLHATELAVGTVDMPGVDVRLRRISAGIHPGSSHSGTFVASTAVTRGTYATARFAFGKLFAGTRVTILRAIKGSTGSWSTYRSVGTVVVASNGYAYYSARVNGNYRFVASVTDILTVGTKVVSPPVYARAK